MEKRIINTYEEAVSYLFDVPKFTTKHTMEDTKAFLHKLGNPDKNMKIIHVAGTNGKGSVCTYLASMLKSAGFTCNVFTSPHLEDVRERFLTNGKMIEKDTFFKAFMTVYEGLSWEELESGAGYHPSFFEYLFFMAMLIFTEHKADYCILETGLGGRLDATNAVSNKEISVITHMGIDHTEYLGNTLADIAKEKAGIMKENTPVVFWNTAKESTEVFTEWANMLQIPCFSVSKQDYRLLKNSNKSIDFSYSSIYYDSVRLCARTIAEYQMENISLAARAFEVLLGERPDGRSEMEQGVAAAFWPGRMEEILPDIFVDGAHNEDGIRAFLETVSQDGITSKRALVFGVVQDKAYNDMIEKIVSAKLFDKVAVVQMQSARALSVEHILEQFAQFGFTKVESFSSVDEMLGGLDEFKEGCGRVYVAGSLYLVGEIKAKV